MGGASDEVGGVEGGRGTTFVVGGDDGISDGADEGRETVDGDERERAEGK